MRARGGRFSARTRSSRGTKAIQPSGPQSSGGKLAHSKSPETPAAIHTRREEAGEFTERAARMIECTDGSPEAEEVDIERGRVRGVVVKVFAPVPGKCLFNCSDRSVRGPVEGNDIDQSFPLVSRFAARKDGEGVGFDHGLQVRRAVPAHQLDARSLVPPSEPRGIVRG